MDRPTGREGYRAARDLLRDTVATMTQLSGPSVGPPSGPVQLGARLVRPGSGHRRRRPSPCAPQRRAVPTHPSDRIHGVTEDISGKIRRVDLRAPENSCEPNDLVGEYRDR